MRRFAQLFTELDAATATNAKVGALARYFREADPADAAWALFVLVGKKVPRGVTTRQLRRWAAEACDLPEWLMEEAHAAVGDLSETLALLLPNPDTAAAATPPLHRLIEERILPLKDADEAQQRAVILQTWRELTSTQRFLFHKLMSGNFRVGVSRTLVTRALAQVVGIAPATMAHRIMGDWPPTADAFLQLTRHASNASDPGRPYPFFLAYPLDLEVETLGPVADWQVEWKWDGIRAQLIRRAGQTLIWSRGEELMTDRFPELVQAAAALPEGTALDGEILAWSENRPLPFAVLQRRIGRKNVPAKVLAEAPVVFVAYDLLECAGTDRRDWPLAQRRTRLEELLKCPAHAAVRVSPLLHAAAWSDVAEWLRQARVNAVEGVMLKRRASAYGVGRIKGVWWKWKVDPLTVDAVLIQARTGSGRRASLFTDYTFGVWHEGRLVPVAKAYSGLDAAEIRQVDQFVRENTLERHGPVRTVAPRLVFELAFDGIQRSSRHKAGVALRFPRMLRWRHDKPAVEADALGTLQALLPAEVPRPTPSRRPRRKPDPTPNLFGDLE